MVGTQVGPGDNHLHVTIVVSLADPCKLQTREDTAMGGKYRLWEALDEPMAVRSCVPQVVVLSQGEASWLAHSFGLVMASCKAEQM